MATECPTRFFHIADTDGVTVVRLTRSSFDEAFIHQAGDHLDALAGARELHLDLAAVDYLNSSGLAKLVGLHRRSTEAGGRLVLTNPRPFVDEILRVTHLDRVLDVRRQ